MPHPDQYPTAVSTKYSKSANTNYNASQSEKTTTDENQIICVITKI